MPVQYTSILAEHRAVRERAGLFDVSHMGQVHLRGPGALASVERLVTSAVATLRTGRVRYGLLCNEAGGVVDDVTVYRTADDGFFLCVNASNEEKDYGWIVRHARDDAEVRNRSAETGLLALQGPASAAILGRLAGPEPIALRRFQFSPRRIADRDALLSRTGYTGSDGFEIYCAAADTGAIWDALLERGADDGLVPAGLGARDTLRLEAALPLYGHELDDETTPLEAGLERFVDLERGGFLGAEALERQHRTGPGRRLAGFVLEGRGVARAGHTLAHEGRAVGRVTSGAPSPSLGKSIGLGYVPPALAAIGTELAVMIREQPVPARVVPTPFVGRP
jgi:glycine cleavage system T protein (aminomethyltransferase)